MSNLSNNLIVRLRAERITSTVIESNSLHVMRIEYPDQATVKVLEKIEPRDLIALFDISIGSGNAVRNEKHECNFGCLNVFVDPTAGEYSWYLIMRDLDK